MAGEADSADSVGAAAPAVPYDDTRRLECLRASSALFQQHPEIDEAASAYGEESKFESPEENPDHDMTFRFSFPSPDSTTSRYYLHACEGAGAIFRFFTGTLDCVGYGEFNKGKSKVTIFNDAGECFAPGDECRQYVESPADWWIDTDQVFKNDCTLRSSTSPTPAERHGGKSSSKSVSKDATTPTAHQEAGNVDEDSGRTGRIPLVAAGTLVMAFALMAGVVLTRRRRRKQRERTMQVELSQSATYTDRNDLGLEDDRGEEGELPPSIS